MYRTTGAHTTSVSDTIDIIRVTWIGNAYRLICPSSVRVEVRVSRGVGL